MAEFTKERAGKWAKAAEIKSGSRAKILDEATRSVSSFKNPDGSEKMQTVARVRFEGVDEPLNVNLNRATIYGLIDAFGTESKGWVGHALTAHTEKTTVAGKRVTVLYLLANGFVVGESEDGYVVITRRDSETEQPPTPTRAPNNEGNSFEDFKGPDIQPSDLPF